MRNSKLFILQSHRKKLLFSVSLVASTVLFPISVLAQALPGPADASRIETPDFEGPKFSVPSGIEVPESIGIINAPEGAKDIFLDLKHIKIEGVTAFTPGDLKPIYQQYEGQHVSPDVVWKIAAQITERYRNKRYFLSRAYVPAQEIEDGNITIRVVEGYVGEVQWQGENKPDSWIIDEMTKHLIAQRPLTTNKIESYLLRVNDIPGASYRAVVQPIEGGDEGAVAVVMLGEEKKGLGVVRLDNTGSRFLGPYQGSVFYQDSFIKNQQTMLGISGSLPMDELKYITASHQIPVAPKINFEMGGSYIKANPGYTLEPNDIVSKSGEINMGFTYQPIRQWLENLSVGIKFTAKDTDSDILGTPLTRDRIRALRASMSYDTADFFDGYSYWNATVSQGIEVLGSSGKGDADLSRPEAEPDFTKLELSYLRQQPFGKNFLLVGRVAGQLASGPLYSSEEFGYGGQTFGRAYDPSEITGDNGLSGSVELRYTSYTPFENYELTPYVFYDIGKVWNDDKGGDNISGSSAGIGLYMNLPHNLMGTFTVAQPLTKNIDNPLYGEGEKAPRFVFDLSYRF